MRVYLVQHGDALSADVHPDRPLSERGRQDVERLASLLQTCGIRVTCAVHSGKTRAAQTAERLAAVVSPGREVQLLQGLGPNDPVEPLVRQIGGWGEDKDKLIVGHMPLLGRLAARLVAGDEERAVVAFSPGTVVCLEKAEEAHWVVCWMVRPELLAVGSHGT
jgi:phosphohistidine phosphatase